MVPYIVAAGALVSIVCYFLEDEARRDAEQMKAYIRENFEKAARTHTRDLHRQFSARMSPDVRQWFDNEIGKSPATGRDNRKET